MLQNQGWFVLLPPVVSCLEAALPVNSLRILLTCLAIGLMAVASAGAEDRVDFGRDVAPILEKRCLLCHREGDPQGELSLATPKGLRELELIVPGDPDASPLLKVISSAAGQRARMPKSGEPLSATQVDVLRRWIREGADWPADAQLPRLWSLASLSYSLPPAPNPPPSDASHVEGLFRPESAIDRFVLRQLLERGLRPSAPAARSDLIRRLKFDLLGLPPTPDEIQTFVNDTRPDAWERLIDTYLASPHYGERWGRHWLDVVRFGESDGFEDDDPRSLAWPYRDYVIHALNADKPYDQFVREQLAGDVLEPVTQDGIIATSMLVNGPFDRAAAVSASKLEQLRSREEMLEELLTTVSQTFLGLTVNCARCHDHKFDPIPQTDYYRLKAVFDGVHQSSNSRFDPTPTLIPEAAAAWEKQVARSLELTAELTRLKAARAEATDPAYLPPLNRAMALWQFDGGGQTGQSEPDRKGGQSRLEAKGTAQFGMPAGGPIGAANSDQKVLDTGDSRILENVPGGAGYAIIPELEGSELLPKPGALSIFARVRFTGSFEGVDDVLRIGARGDRDLDTCGFQMEAAGDGQSEAVPRFVVTGKGQPREVGVSWRTPLAVDRWYDLTGVFAPGRIMLSVADSNTGKLLGEPVSLPVPFEALEAGGSQNLLVFVAPSFSNGAQPKAQMDFAAVWPEALSAEDVLRLSAQRGAEETKPTTVAEATAVLDRQIAGLEAELAVFKQQEAAVPRALIGLRRAPGITVLFERGDVRSPGATVTPGGLSAIRQQPADWDLPANSSDAERRRRFAAWVTDSRNPLTARVIVNRVWQHHFGIGLVDTPSDFGVNGGRPSHPELLDWLAATFMEEGWSLKRLHRRILASATWQQASTMNETALKVDADNRLLWRFTPQRLDAESTRDAMLAVSGELNTQIGGASYQPFTTTKFNTVFYHPLDSGEPQYNRRTIYRMNVNTGRDPLLDALDCPAPSVLTPARRQTVTPLQALSLMNDTFVLRQAQKLAARVTIPSTERPAQIEAAWRLAFGRTPSEAELKQGAAVVAEADLVTLCWVLLNSSEFLQVR